MPNQRKRGGELDEEKRMKLLIEAEILFAERITNVQNLLGDVVELLRCVLKTEHEILRKLDHIEHQPTGFMFYQLGDFAMDPITLPGLAPGTSGTVTVTPVDKDGKSATLPAGIVPVWSASNDQITITPAADGLSAVIDVDTKAAPDPTTTITVAYPDGSVSSTTGFPIDPNPAPPVGEVVGFTFAQS